MTATRTRITDARGQAAIETAGRAPLITVGRRWLHLRHLRSVGRWLAEELANGQLGPDYETTTGRETGARA